MTTTPRLRPDARARGRLGVGQIDLAALRDNVAALARRADVRVDGGRQGRRLRPRPAAVARAALRGGATWLGVAQFAEAFALRDAGVTTPAADLAQRARAADFGGAVERDIDVRRHRLPWVPSTRRGPRARPHRAGPPQGRHRARAAAAPSTDWTTLVAQDARRAGRGRHQVVGIWTHFAYADAPEHPTVLAQQERFFEAARRGRAGGAATRGAPPRQLRRDARAPLGPRRPRAARDRDVRPVPGADSATTTSACARP